MNAAINIMFELFKDVCTLIGFALVLYIACAVLKAMFRAWRDLGSYRRQVKREQRQRRRALLMQEGVGRHKAAMESHFNQMAEHLGKPHGPN